MRRRYLKKERRGSVPLGILAAALAFALLFSACGQGAAEDPEGEEETSEIYFSFTDDTGHRVELKKKPVRAAVLFSSFADVWRLAGGETAITVGESVDRGIVEKETPLADGGAGKTIDLERLIALAPDFVLLSADVPAQAEAAEVMCGLGTPCAAFHMESFSDYLRVLDLCTRITGERACYTRYGAELESQIGEIVKNASERAEKEGAPRILFIRAGSAYSATKAKTSEEHFVCAMLRELGAENIADESPAVSSGLSMEEILLSDPDCIFISTMGNEEAARAYMDGVLAEEAWKRLSAVKNGRCIYLPKELFHYKPNEKWAQAYRYLEELLYPDGDTDQ